MKWCLPGLITRVDFSVLLKQQFSNVDISGEHTTVQRCLPGLVFSVDVCEHLAFISRDRLITELLDLVRLLVTNSLKQLLVDLLFELPPVVPGNDVGTSTLYIHLNDMFFLHYSTCASSCTTLALHRQRI